MVNGLFNALYIIAAGGVLNIAAGRSSLQLAQSDGGRKSRVGEVRNGMTAAQATSGLSIYQEKAPVGLGAGLCESQENLAFRYQNLGRDLKTQGRVAEAIAMWHHTLDLWTEMTTTCSNQPVIHQYWCDCANDLAWLLTNAPDVAVRDFARAIALAGKAAELKPNCATYWNTLGTAHYRAGDYNAAIVALGRAIDLTHGGTAFDHVFLAMALAQIGDFEQAQRWLHHASLWIEQYSPDHFELACLRDEARAVLSATFDTSVTVR
jgi:tetratricopeptide (TPR) repeat protein